MWVWHREWHARYSSYSRTTRPPRFDSRDGECALGFVLSERALSNIINMGNCGIERLLLACNWEGGLSGSIPGR